MVGGTMLFLVAIALAALLGFAAHRASICTVKAVAEIFTAGRANILLCFVKTALWVVLVTLLLMRLMPPGIMVASAWSVSLISVLGGFLFGVGSAINGGCAFSTLGRLMDGYLGMAATLAGVLGASLLASVLKARGLLPAPVHAGAGELLGEMSSTLIAGALLALALIELWRLRRPVDAGLGAFSRFLAPRYRLSSTAALIGISNALLFALLGSWVFTSAMARTLEQGAAAAGDPTIVMLWALFAAVLAGMFVSALQRHSFRIEVPSAGDWAAHFVGGLLMGAGAAIIPGGNDALILSAIPALSPHALPAYAALLAGIAATFAVIRFVGGRVPEVHCHADICIED